MAQNSDATAMGVPIAIGPSQRPDVLEAVIRGGGRIVDFAEAHGCVWLDLGDLDGLRASLHPELRWVQLPAAGIENWIDHIASDAGRTYTAATGAYSPQVAEHTLALLLAGARLLHRNARSRTWQGREAREGTTLIDEDVLIVGCGGIGRALIDLLVPFRSHVIAVTRSGNDVEGAAESHAFEDLPQLWGRARFVVLSAPLTAETRHIVDATALDRMRSDTWIVNVGRGALIDTDALIAAATSDRILGAALDVTAPEPLPDDHPLWDIERILITPHTANPKPLLLARLAERIEENVRRFADDEPLIGEVTPGAGY
jgi:phosphoglycerate dehydrogenase-like enzyme